MTTISRLWTTTFLMVGWKIAVASAAEGLALISWLRQNGGFFSHKIEFRQLDPNDDTSPNGLFAKGALKRGELLMQIPHKCLVKSADASMCGAARALADHRRAGKESFFQEYMDYLFDGTKTRKLPGRWSDEGKEILETLLGEELPTPVIEQSYRYGCVEDTNVPDQIELLDDAFELVVARAWTDTMVPLLDMINHRNGHWLNVESSSAHTGEDITVFTIKDVQPGEQLYITYNECNDSDCKGIFYFYGTQEIFGDYGFVEQYPQRWIWNGFSSLVDYDEPLIFELDQVQAEDPYSGEMTEQLQVTWHSDTRPDLQMLNVMTSHLKALDELKDYVQMATESLESENEKFTIREYYEALKLALKYAIWASYDEAIDDLYGTGDQKPSLRPARPNDTFETRPGSVSSCPLENGSTEVDKEEPSGRTARRYDSLDARPVIGNEDDSILSTCHPKHLGMGKTYQKLYQTNSMYQTIEYTHGVEEQDTCLWLNGWGQTCTFFRVYHETLVHYPASFIPNVKRVAYLGGGDSMILHEILKYSSIELVVGMELDQQVVRSSFMNFGTRPYFDDPRVQWWFGDATKSLRLLPREYFGSFDLVLVDLQTFVADSLYVTDSISVMDAMKLLLKESHGIIAKNEDFPNRKVVDFARYTVDLEYSDIPQICLQSVTIGSNEVNFLTAPQYDHNVTRLYLKESLDLKTRFKNWYGFRDNLEDASNSKMTSSNDQKPVNPTPSNSKSRPNSGVLMVLEAEELSGAVKTKDEFVAAVTSSLVSQRFNVESVKDGSSENSSSQFDVVLVFREGYLVLRKRPTIDNYIGVDLLLWDAVDKVNPLKAAILKAIGGSEETASSYYVITGGIQEIGGESHLVKRTARSLERKTCENEAKEVNNVSEALEWTDFAHMIPAETTSIVVLCGSSDHVCESYEALKSSAINAVALYSCEGSVTVSEGSSVEQQDLLFQCEANMMKSIRKHTSSGTINGIFLDPKSTRTMGRVLLRLLTGLPGRAEVLDERNYVVVAEVTGAAWREVFVERFRTEVSPFAPSKEARLSAPDGRKFAFFSAGNDSFYQTLVDWIGTLQTERGQAVTVESVMSGHASYVRDFDPETSNNADFDNTKAYEQWMSQESIGFQTIFQMELQAPKAPLKLGEEVLYQYDDNVWVGRWTRATIAKINDDSTYNVVAPGDVTAMDVPRHQLRRLDFDADAVNSNATIDAGERVLIRDGDVLWTQGFVMSRSDDGDLYEVRQFDNIGSTWKVELNDLMPENETPVKSELPTLSKVLLGKIFRKALGQFANDHTTQKQALHSIGDGCVVTGFWDGGNAILVWDGSIHIDINLYLDREDRTTAEKFPAEFLSNIRHLELVARDEQPRGYGRVVNLVSEIRRDYSPIWWPQGYPHPLLWPDREEQ